MSPTPSRANNRAELDSLISSLVDRPGRDESPIKRGDSRPTSIISLSQQSTQEGGSESPLRPGTALSSPAPPFAPPQTLTFAPLTTVYDLPASPKRDVITYSKGVQTSDDWSPDQRKTVDQSASEDEAPLSPSRTRKRLSRRERERDEELRQNIRKEIEEELEALKLSEDKADHEGKENFPARTLTEEELNAVTASDEFADFIERSTKVIERSLEEQYDILADYALRGMDGLEDDDDEDGTTRTKKGRRVKELHRFQDERWTKGRMISDLDFSVKVCCRLSANAPQYANYDSTPSFYYLLIPSPPPQRKAHEVLLSSGTLICQLAPNMSSQPQATFSPLASLHTILVSSLEAHILDRSASGIFVKDHTTVLPCKEHL